MRSSYFTCIASSNYKPPLSRPTNWMTNDSENILYPPVLVIDAEGLLFICNWGHWG